MLTEGAVEMVRHGYDEPRRCLHFRVGFYRDPEGVREALKVIDSYNEFDHERVWKHLQPFIEKAHRVEVGREGSPVLYIETHNYEESDLDALISAAKAARADEIGPGAGERPPAPIRRLRLWWD